MINAIAGSAQTYYQAVDSNNAGKTANAANGTNTVNGANAANSVNSDSTNTAARTADGANARQDAPAAGKQDSVELTTVTTHCNKNHKHTRSCPHTSITRPAASFGGKGQYLDVLA